MANTEAPKPSTEVPVPIIDLTAYDEQPICRKPEDESPPELESSQSSTEQWETDSMYEDIIEEIQDDEIVSGKYFRLSACFVLC